MYHYIIHIAYTSSILVSIVFVGDRQAMAMGWLPQQVVPYQECHDDDGRVDLVVDLHGLGRAMAKTAVLEYLESLLVGQGPIKGDLYIITGRGLRSRDGKPVLKPFLFRLLHQDIDPPLIAEDVKGNPGILRISKDQLIRSVNEGRWVSTFPTSTVFPIVTTK